MLKIILFLFLCSVSCASCWDFRNPFEFRYFENFLLNRDLFLRERRLVEEVSGLKSSLETEAELVSSQLNRIDRLKRFQEIESFSAKTGRVEHFIESLKFLASIKTSSLTYCNYTKIVRRVIYNCFLTFAQLYV